MPSTMEVRSFGSIRRQSLWNQRFTASSCSRFMASGSLGKVSVCDCHSMPFSLRKVRSSSESCALYMPPSEAAKLNWKDFRSFE